ncbi:hypothetical protein HZB88_00790 [archaeon]|nr:hypothetical protein [archaeon]
MKKQNKKIKAIALLSGGLDSMLAVKLMKEQGIDVIALNFTSPFCLCNRGCRVKELGKKLGVKVFVKNKGKEYLRIVRNPKHGYGRGLNPCIDCRIFILKKAEQFARKIKARFIFTGEVLNERPMSQHLNALKIIEKEAGLEVLRPLSAKLLEETEAERKGLVNRNKLLGISGRRRKEQIELAKRYGLDFPCPSGGCLLTYKEFAGKAKDLFEHKKQVTLKDIRLLKIGRHFRYKDNKIIVGRDEKENKLLEGYGKNILKPVSVPGPSILIQGRADKRILNLAGSILAYYADKHENILVRYKKREFTANAFDGVELDSLRIKWER